ncbi:MAG: SDR family oxidoreductase [Bacteroidia bacterium]|nr:SDR family oxidoreductase [Bacteroidia bacterium]|tara:strand:- start:139 stop:912 length:774 start_codon:yes stop_codon:yes gene_type:complete
MKKIIWITGAGSGIGRALAESYSHSDHTIVLSGRNKAQLEAVSKDILNPYILPLDVTQEKQINQAVSTIQSTFGRVDILINNAGISQRATVTETTNEVGRALMEVNFFGSVHLTKAVLPMMLDANQGSIVAMSSAAGKFGFPLRSYYSASKHALHGFYESLSLELKDTPLHVMIVCPGRIKTDISKHALTGSGESHNQMDQGQLHGIPVEKCASKIVRGLSKKKFELYIGGNEILLVYIKRYFPFLFRQIAKRVNPK